VIADLQGPKFRIAEVFWTGVRLEEGSIVSFALATTDSDLCVMSGTGVRITMKPTVEHTALLRALEVGTVVCIEEGKRQLSVTERVSACEVKARVIHGGRLNAFTAVEAPGLKVDCPAVTAKDIIDTEFLLGLDPPIDYIAVSFVQKGADLQELIDIMDRLGVPTAKRPRICPRIERPQALANLDDILQKSGGVIVARGELGFELGLEGVPFAQKVIISIAKARRVFPVMVSSQLMESMIKNAVPTRAEVSDVANAVFDGADVVMLSGETAKGRYPVESVTAMAACARVAETQKLLLTPGLGLLREGAGVSQAAVVAGPPAHADIKTTSSSPAVALRASEMAGVSFKGRIVVMMGPPACGKGTQCKRIAKDLGLVHLSVGDIVRDEIERGTELGAQVDVFMSRGEMVSDALTLSIVRDRLARADVAECGCLLDGFPRTGVQSECLAANVEVDRFMLFDVPDDTVVRRALGRLNDPISGAIYHLQFAPPPTEVVARLVRRQNDTSEVVVRNRLEFYHAQLGSITSHFRDRLQEVDGTKSIEEVFEAVKRSLTGRLDKRIDPSEGKVYTFAGFNDAHPDLSELGHMRVAWDAMAPAGGDTI